MGLKREFRKVQPPPLKWEVGSTNVLQERFQKGMSAPVAPVCAFVYVRERVRVARVRVRVRVRVRGVCVCICMRV